MAVSKDEILESISNMSIMQVVELIADMEKKFGVTAAAPVAAAAAGPPSTIKDGVNMADSEAMKKKLEEASAKVEIK